MLLLLIHSAKNTYAISTQIVLEVLPQVKLQKISLCPDYISGTFNYRGQVVAVVDLMILLYNRQCDAALSTRIIVLQLGEKEKAIVAVLAEGVFDTVHIDESAIKKCRISLPQANYLTNLIVQHHSTIQLIDINRLLPLDLKEALFPQIF